MAVLPQILVIFQLRFQLKLQFINLVFQRHSLYFICLPDIISQCQSVIFILAPYLLKRTDSLLIELEVHLLPSIYFFFQNNIVILHLFLIKVPDV